MKPLTKENILDALRVVKDPDLHRDIITLNFVKDIQIDGKTVSVTMELTTPACPVRDQFKLDIADAIKGTVEGVKHVDVKLTSKVIVHDSAQREATLPGVKNTIAVASGKGGVGKSTIAVNVAVALVQEGAKVGLIDSDVYGPSAPLMMNLTTKPKVVNQKLIPLESYGVKVMSIGLLVDPMQAIIWRGPMASGAVKQFISDVVWGELDYLIFDLPPGTGDVQLTLVQSIPLTGGVIVTTPQDISLADARKGLKMFERVNVSILGIVENMSYYLCPQCGHRDEIFSYGGGRKISEEMGVPFLGELPIVTDIRVGGDTGRPIVIQNPESQQAKAVFSIARNMAAQISIRHLTAVETPKVDIQIGEPQT